MFMVGWYVSSLDSFCLRSVIYWMKNAWVSRSPIQSISRIIYVNADGSCAGSCARPGGLSGEWLSKDWRCACKALQAATKCSGSSFPELQSLHVGFPVDPLSLLALVLIFSVFGHDGNSPRLSSLWFKESIIFLCVWCQQKDKTNCLTPLRMRTQVTISIVIGWRMKWS